MVPRPTPSNTVRSVFPLQMGKLRPNITDVGRSRCKLGPGMWLVWSYTREPCPVENRSAAVGFALP